MTATATAIQPTERSLDTAKIAASAQRYAQAAADEIEAWAKRTAPADHAFNELAAERACQFFPRYLKHTRGRWYGQEFDLEPWQRAVIRTTFGWKRPDGSRRFRIVYAEIPRKNGKTGLAAGVGLYLTFADNEIGAEVYSFANDTDQASIAFNEALRMRAQSDALKRRSLAYKKAIVVGRTSSSYKVLSSETGNKDGLNVSGLIGDEIHALKDALLYEVLHTAEGARVQPLEFLITTAGHDHHSFCGQMHNYAIKVRDGIIEDSEFLPVIFGADKDADYSDPEVWARVNPSLGVTISVDYLAKEARRARELPRYENEFKRVHLGIWTEQMVRWLPMDRWDACVGEQADEDALAGRQCWGGLDLSSTRDITALAYVFPWEDEDGPEGYDVLCRCWLPGRDLRAREKRDGVPYGKWASDGFLELTKGEVADHDAVKRQLLVDAEKFRIAEVAYDDWGAHKLVIELGEEGLTMVPIRQGFKTLSPPSKLFETLVVKGHLGHMQNPLLRWMASNAVIETDARENIKPTKDPKKATGRIDGVLAIVQAIARASIAEPPKPSMYETRGMVVE